VHYIVELICATRKNEHILRGASPRATLALTAMAKAIAQLQGRDYVTPADVQSAFPFVLTHRILMTPTAQSRGITSSQVLDTILRSTAAPSFF